jgi:hypothetical protein
MLAVGIYHFKCEQALAKANVTAKAQEQESVYEFCFQER